MFTMRIRALGATAAAVLLASLSTAGQSKPAIYKVPRTPWGEPDLQGTYNARDLQGVPLERAASLTRNVRERDLLLERARACRPPQTSG